MEKRVSLCLLFVAIVIFIFGLDEQWVLRYYVEGIYPIVSVCLRWLSSLFPFAVGDFLYLLLILVSLWYVVLLIRRRKSLTRQQLNRIPFHVLNFGLSLYIIFKVCWGLNYSRPSVSTQLSISNERYSVDELVILTNFFVDRLNEVQKTAYIKPDYNLDEVRAEAILAYQNMEKVNEFFRYLTPSFKACASSWATTKIGIEGYYNPISAEANLNMMLPTWVLPFVACHEIAHQLGVAREDEANLVGYLTAVNSQNLQFQYSAIYNMLRYLLVELRIKSSKDYEIIYQRISPEILANFKKENEFWQKYNNQMSGYMSLAFDKFLKLNNQQSGIKSYQNIVIWLWNYHKKDLPVDGLLSAKTLD